MSGRSESCSHKADHLLCVGQSLAGDPFEELREWRSRKESIRIAGGDMVAVEAGAGILDGRWHWRVSFDRLAKLVEIVTLPAGPKMLQGGFEGFLRGLLAGEAAPCPMAADQQVARRREFAERLSQPIAASVHGGLL